MFASNPVSDNDQPTRNTSIIPKANADQRPERRPDPPPPVIRIQSKREDTTVHPFPPTIKLPTGPAAKMGDVMVENPINHVLPHKKTAPSTIPSIDNFEGLAGEGGDEYGTLKKLQRQLECVFRTGSGFFLGSSPG